MPADLFPRAYWRYVLCDLDGNPISMLSSIALNKRMEFPLNRPSQFSFTVASDSQLVNTPYTDDGFGEPYLTVGCRTVRAYRKLSTESSWTGVANWLVWSLQDQGDGDSCRTSVTCFDPLQRLVKRLNRRADGTFAKTVRFNGKRGNFIAKTLVDRTISFAGPCGIDTGGTFEDTSVIPIVEYEQAYIGPSLASLTDTGTMDIYLEPQFGTDGIQAQMNVYEMLGEEKPSKIFGYAAPPRSAGTLDRSLSMDDVANDITMWPSSTKRKAANMEDGDSKDKYTPYESAEVIADVHTTEMVADLVEEQLALRKDPRDMIAITPFAGKSPVWWRDYKTGDIVPVQIGTTAGRPPTRDAVSGLQRIYNVVIAPSDDGVERIEALECEPQT